MTILLNGVLFLVGLLGLVVSLANWCFLFQSLKTKENHSPIGFIGGALVFASLYYLLPAAWHSAAYLAFIIDGSYPFFVIGVFLCMKK